MKIDALILAGTGKGYIPVEGANKALLEINGRPIIEYVVQALKNAGSIGDIHIVGPVDELSFLLKSHGDRVTLHEQTGSLVDNVISSYDRICPSRDRHILVTTSDIPFIRPYEIDLLVSSSNYEAYDIVVGVGSAEALRRFAPDKGMPGMSMACCHFRQQSGRLNNMFILRPPREAIAEYASILYNLRYQKNIVNFLRLIVNVIIKDPGRLPLLWTLFKLQLTLQADRFALMGIAQAIGNHIDIRKAEMLASRAVKARVRIMFMDYGGAAIDIDNAQSLEVARTRYEEFTSLAEQRP